MNQINDPANRYDFGLAFNYSQWVPGTHVSLVNVPWNNDYRDIVKFADRNALNAYIDGLEVAGVGIPNLSLLKPNEPVRINLPFNKAYKYNYLRASNPVQPIPGNDVAKDFYYFITGVNYLSPNTTELVLQLDVWQTFGYDVKFGNCYIERGHIGMANANQFSSYGRDYLTIPEGLDVGGEYRTIAKRRDTIMGYTPVQQGGGTLIQENFDVLMVTTVDITADPGTVAAPNLVTAQGGFFENLATGADMWVFPSVDAFAAFMIGFQKYPWITQGIISVTMVPKMSRYKTNMVYNPFPLPTRASSYTPVPHKNYMWQNWRTSSELLNTIPARYRKLQKFLTYPYMCIELTTWNATPVVLKPESWQNPNAYVMERITYTPPNQRLEVSPRQYNSNGQQMESYGQLPDNFITFDGQRETGDDYGDYLDIATIVQDFPSVPVVNNGQLSYLAANAHSIAYQYSSADWAQQRAMMGNQTSYDQASGGMNLANDITNIGVRANTQSTNIANRNMAAQAVVGGINDVVHGAIGGAAGGSLAGPGGTVAGALGGAAVGGIGAAMGGISAGLNIGANTEQTAVQNAAANQRNTASVGQMGMVRDTNKNLADWAARGDYENSILAINAKVQDARLIQPSMSGQMGGQAMNLVNQTAEVSLRWKLIDNAAIRRVGEFWLRYGYAVQQFAHMPDDLMVMSHFTYWKLSETYISAAGMPETFKQSIRGIFEKGVTVWSDPNIIGNLDIADNDPKQGITL